MLTFPCPRMARINLLNISTFYPNKPHFAHIKEDSIKYGKNSDKITHAVESLLLNKSNKKFAQQVLGSQVASYITCM